MNRLQANLCLLCVTFGALFVVAGSVLEIADFRGRRRALEGAAP